jgi:hypothetical protein
VEGENQEDDLGWLGGLPKLKIVMTTAFTKTGEIYYFDTVISIKCLLSL